MMTDIMHAHVKGPDLADPTGAKEEQLYVCRSVRPQHLDRAPGVPQRLTTPQGCQAYPPKRGSYSSQALGRPGEPAQARLTAGAHAAPHCEHMLRVL